MMSDAVDPRPQGAAAIVLLKAPPHLKMNILGEVAPLFQISFVGPREPFECGSELFHGLPVEVILARLPSQDGLSTSHSR